MLCFKTNPIYVYWGSVLQFPGTVWINRQSSCIPTSNVLYNSWTTRFYCDRLHRWKIIKVCHMKLSVFITQLKQRSTFEQEKVSDWKKKKTWINQKTTLKSSGVILELYRSAVTHKLVLPEVLQSTCWVWGGVRWWWWWNVMRAHVSLWFCTSPLSWGIIWCNKDAPSASPGVKRKCCVHKHCRNGQATLCLMWAVSRDTFSLSDDHRIKMTVSASAVCVVYITYSSNMMTYGPSCPIATIAISVARIYNSV